MNYRILGRSGLRVSELCLGTMTFGSDWGWGADRDDSRRIFDAFVSAGGNFIDTANNYTDGSSEEFVGEFVAEARDRFVLATKYTLSIDADDPNAGGTIGRASSGRWSRASAGCGPTTSICCGCTCTTRPRRSRRRCARSTTRFGSARSGGRDLRLAGLGGRTGQHDRRALAAGLRSRPCRFPTTSPRASPNGSSCRWRRRSASR